jgi:uncharacterized protein (TIGR03435 family)
LPVYALVVAKNGPKLHSAKVEEKDCPDDLASSGIRCHQLIGGQGRGIHGQAVDLSDVVTFVANWTDSPLVNRTGLQGLFEIDTDGWTPMRFRPPPPPGTPASPEDAAFADPTHPTLDMIFDRLGLKMERSKDRVEMFAITHVERPTEN